MLEDFEDWELIDELKFRGYSLLDDSYGSLIDNMQVDELLEGFLKLDFKSRDIVLKVAEALKTK